MNTVKTHSSPTASARLRADNAPTKPQGLFTVFYLVLSFYVFSVGTMQGLINYPVWALVGEDEFKAFHQAVSANTIKFFVPFVFLSLPVSILMIWLRHPVISRNLVILAAIINLLIFIVTSGQAIPIQEQLDQGKSTGLLNELIFIHVLHAHFAGTDRICC